MPNNKVKTSGMLQGKKGTGSHALHERSRRAKQVVRVGMREGKLKDAKKRRQRANIDKIDRLMHFAHAIDDELPSVSLAQLHALVDAYLCRHDDSIQELEKERRPGRPKAKQQERLETERDQDRREYIEGFLVPDLTDAAAVKELRHWRDHHAGNTGFVPRLRLIRILKGRPDEFVVVRAGGDATNSNELMSLEHEDGMDE